MERQSVGFLDQDRDEPAEIRLRRSYPFPCRTIAPETAGTEINKLEQSLPGGRCKRTRPVQSGKGQITEPRGQDLRTIRRTGMVKRTAG